MAHSVLPEALGEWEYPCTALTRIFLRHVFFPDTAKADSFGISTNIVLRRPWHSCGMSAAILEPARPLFQPLIKRPSSSQTTRLTYTTGSYFQIRARHWFALSQIKNKCMLWRRNTEFQPQKRCFQPRGGRCWSFSSVQCFRLCSRALTASGCGDELEERCSSFRANVS